MDSLKRHNSSEYLEEQLGYKWDLGYQVEYEDVVEQFVTSQEIGLYFRGYEYYFEPYTYYVGMKGSDFFVGGKIDMDGRYVEFFDVMSIDEIKTFKIFDGLCLKDACPEMTWINY